jgi:serine/threonine protein kinase
VADLVPGQRFERYTIESLIGQGGMGRVYRAYDARLQRRVALKLMRRDAFQGVQAGDRMLREARAAAALSHPNAVAIFDVGEFQGTAFFSMELVEGQTLRAYVGDPALRLEQKLVWLLDVARALAAAHRTGLIHRDVKPENVIVCASGMAKVLDFGIAKRARAGPSADGEAGTFDSLDAPPSTMTADGRVRGTPRYMAPEQWRGHPVDARCDQYAWGVVAYELLAGRHPMAEPVTTPEAPPPPLVSAAVPAVPVPVAEIIGRALSPRIELRYPTMEELVLALVPYVVRAGSPSHAPLAATPTPGPVPQTWGAPGTSTLVDPRTTAPAPPRARLPAWLWVWIGLVSASLLVAAAVVVRSILIARPLLRGVNPFHPGAVNPVDTGTAPTVFIGSCKVTRGGLPTICYDWSITTENQTAVTSLKHGIETRCGGVYAPSACERAGVLFGCRESIPPERGGVSDTIWFYAPYPGKPQCGRQFVVLGPDGNPRAPGD